MLFQLDPLRFSFVAGEPIHFEAGKSSNILRGAFGTIFRRITCVPECRSAKNCERRATCAYARLFEPAASSGPSGLADSPRPFVFRSTHLDGRSIATGQSFHFDLNLFDLHSPALSYLVLTFAQLASEGLGVGRRKVILTSVTRLNSQGGPSEVLYEEGIVKTLPNSSPLCLDLSPEAVPISRVTVRFLTPTELKGGAQIATEPDFGVLAARARDRISTLRELYGEGSLPIDFRAFGRRASLVNMTRCDIRSSDITRRSTRTGQVHSIGGFIGEADYEGDLSEFLPFLRAARWTGVGRHTVWGKGEITV